MNEEDLHEWTQSAGGDDFREIPRTWLEVNSFGQVRDSRTKKWFGSVVYRDDLKGVVRGELPAYDPHIILPTDKPDSYFRQRYRNEDNADLGLPRARRQIQSAEEFFRKKGNIVKINGINDKVVASDIEEVFRQVPNTEFEVSNFRRVRNPETKEWFGRLRKAADMDEVLAGAVSIRNQHVIQRTNNPGTEYWQRKNA